MQTFVPFPSSDESAHLLGGPWLGKQLPVPAMLQSPRHRFPVRLAAPVDALVRDQEDA